MKNCPRIDNSIKIIVGIKVIPHIQIVIIRQAYKQTARPAMLINSLLRKEKVYRKTDI